MSENTFTPDSAETPVPLTAQEKFLQDVAVENVNASARFPSTYGAYVALGEEVGELAKALMDESWARVYEEAVQVASMAMRIAVEGDPSINPIRTKHGLGLKEDVVTAIATTYESVAEPVVEQVVPPITDVPGNPIKYALEIIGGPTKVAHLCRVSSVTVHNWVRLGYIPDFDLAKLIAKEANVSLSLLRKPML